MKKIFAALVASAFIASPALAQDDAAGVKLGIGGYFKGYVVAVDQDGDDARAADIVRDTELHFTGSTTLDNGLTVGADIGAAMDQGDSADVTDSFVYFSGDFGRVNAGATDGAAYLLQVSAPSVDAVYDGMDQYFTALNYAVTGVSELEDIEFDYDQDLSTPSDKLTYFTPNFGGFQAAVSWTPESRSASRALDGVDSATGLSDIVDVAARFDNEASFGSYSVGAGYTVGESRKIWNVGVDVNVSDFGFGVVYTDDNMDEGAAIASATDQTQWIAGVDYTVGSYVWGASYLHQNNEFGADEIDTDRYTAGLTYKYAPGIDMRGLVSHLDHDVDAALGDDVSGTALMLGTAISF